MEHRQAARALKAYPLEQRRRITFEYVLLAGVNDSLADAAQLAKLLRGIKCKVNIIPYNPHPEAPYARPAEMMRSIGSDASSPSTT